MDIQFLSFCLETIQQLESEGKTDTKLYKLCRVSLTQQRRMRNLQRPPYTRRYNRRPAQRLDHPTLVGVAVAHAVSPAQVMVRWSIQRGYVPLPKSVRPERVAQNLDVFRFELSAAEMDQLDQLDEQLFTEWEEWGSLDPTRLP